jgi:hypothetical protein
MTTVPKLCEDDADVEEVDDELGELLHAARRTAAAPARAATAARRLGSRPVRLRRAAWPDADPFELAMAMFVFSIFRRSLRCSLHSSLRGC